MNVAGVKLLTLVVLIASTAVCEQTSDTIRIEGPSIVAEGSALLLRCILPTAQQGKAVEWKTPTIHQVSMNESQLRSTMLKIDATKKQYFGRYRCCVNSCSTTCGEISVSVLYVKPASSFVASSEHASGNVTLMQDTELTIKVYHGPQAEATILFQQTGKEFCDHFKNVRDCELRKKGESTKFTIKNPASVDSGTFVVNIARNGTIETYRLHIEILDSSFLLHVIIGSAVALTLVCSAAVLYVWKRFSRRTATDDKLDEVSPLAEFIPVEYIFPMRKVRLGEIIGEGEYGVVVKGLAEDILVHEPSTTVAVKIIKKNCNLELLIRELKIVIELGQHLNVVNFLGATSDARKGKCMMIFEYCPHGSVLDCMRKNRSNFEESDDLYPFCRNDGTPELQKGASSTGKITTIDLIAWAMQIATGMTYLASKNVLHGDLAARNVLLSDKNVVKISDFGLSRIIRNGGKYKASGEDTFPVKWLALESIGQHVFSVKTDVWSYGVLVWELFSLGASPYPGLESENFYSRVRDGYRMDRPDHATEDVHDIMLSCWRVNPDTRPSFDELAREFDRMLPEELRSCYARLNSPYLQTNYRRIQQPESEYLQVFYRSERHR